jgi:hypothetical protein
MWACNLDRTTGKLASDAPGNLKRRIHALMRAGLMNNGEGWSFYTAMAGLVAGCSALAGWIAHWAKSFYRKGADQSYRDSMDRSHQKQLADHEQRLRALEETNSRLERLETNVEWIKQRLASLPERQFHPSDDDR